MKNKKSLIIIIVLLVILVLCGGAFAYVYFATDLLKSNSQMFAKYGENLVENLEEFFDDGTLISYYKNRFDKNHENSGIINVKAKTNEDTSFDGNISLSFKGTSDVDNGNFEQEININYSNSEKFTFKIVKDDKTIALGADEIANKYVGIKNEDLNEFVDKLGLDVATAIPESIEVNKDELNWSNINNLVNKYLQLVKGSLTDENFNKNSDGSFSLIIENDNLKNIILTCLNEARNDEEVMKVFGADEISAYQKNIDEIIENVNKNDYSNTLLRVTLKKNGETNAITIDVDILTEEANANYTISIENAKTIRITQNYSSSDTENSKTIELILSKDVTENKSQYTLTGSTDDFTIELGFGLDNISENGATEKISASYNDTNNEMSVEFNNAVTFKDQVTVTELNDDNSVVLNNYSQEDLNNLLQQLFVQIVTVNSRKIQNAYGF